MPTPPRQKGATAHPVDTSKRLYISVSFVSLCYFPSAITDTNTRSESRFRENGKVTYHWLIISSAPKTKRNEKGTHQCV